MILEFIINFILEIIKSLFNIIRALISPIEAPVQMLIFLTQILTICTQANNFLHFIVGDFIVVLLPLTIGLIGIKYTVYPILQFLRSVFVNSNE